MPEPPLHDIGRLLLILGLILAAAGAVLLFWDKLPLDRLPLGRLPGDIDIRRENFRFSFPLVTCIVISIILTILFNIFRK